jgi:hypothetical protein
MSNFLLEFDFNSIFCYDNLVHDLELLLWNWIQNVQCQSLQFLKCLIVVYTQYSRHQIKVWFIKHIIFNLIICWTWFAHLQHSRCDHNEKDLCENVMKTIFGTKAIVVIWEDLKECGT